MLLGAFDSNKKSLELVSDQSLKTVGSQIISEYGRDVKNPILSLIWLFCGKAVDTLIDRTTKRAMRIIYNTNNEEVLDALLQKDENSKIHKRN